MRESFVFYRSFYEAILELDNLEEQLELFSALCEYNFEGKKPQFKFKNTKAMFRIIQPLIDNATARYMASVENGKKGGAPLGNQNARKYPKNNLEQPKNNLNENDNVNENVNDNDNDNVSDRLKTTYSPTQPSLSSIISYGIDLGIDEDYCKRFYEYYEGIGWVNGNGLPIKNWKLVLSKWYKKDKADGKIKQQAPSRRLD